MTDPKEIIRENEELLNTVLNNMINLNSACLAFSESFDQYNRTRYKDGSFLRNRMKEEVIKAVRDGEL